MQRAGVRRAVQEEIVHQKRNAKRKATAMILNSFIRWIACTLVLHHQSREILRCTVRVVDVTKQRETHAHTEREQRESREMRLSIANL